LRIGLDFDNTIVRYDDLFHKIASELQVLPENIPTNKVAIRDYLRTVGLESVWTEMQGLAYGKRLDEALAYDGAINFLEWARDNKHEVFIISHKTKYPFLGPKYDLHDAAMAWIDNVLISSGKALINKSNIYFELTKEEKINRITHSKCNFFLDDLPEILLSENFSNNTCRFLFDPDENHSPVDFLNFQKVKSWQEFLAILMG
jgi:hypothetical protein